MLQKTLHVALVQTSPVFDFSATLKRVEELIRQAKQEKPETELIVLPEHFSTPINKELYNKHAETIPGPRCAMFSKLATELGVYIIGGSFPERDGDVLYNTSLSFNKAGEIIGKHRKIHLFDIDIPGKITAKESESFATGKSATITTLAEFGKIGQAICYDIRFPELATIAARNDAFMMVYPSAFNTTTGPLHWSLLARARALDNQMYVIMCSPARSPEWKYPVYGHSMVVNPSGHILAEAGEGEDIVYASLDPEFLREFRENIPIRKQTRFDVYKDISEGAVTSTIEVVDSD